MNAMTVKENVKYYEKYCNFSNNTKNKAKKLLQHGWKSYKKS
ncbi:hypothetical protein [Methanobrevibacter oralis]|nr:hypothetical protein [Methanobrevibacter oralis]